MCVCVGGGVDMRAEIFIASYNIIMNIANNHRSFPALRPRHKWGFQYRMVHAVHFEASKPVRRAGE